MERGAELYYGNYMINTTRPWALSSPSRSSFQSRSSTSFSSISGRNPGSSRDFAPVVFLLGALSLSHPPYLPTLVQSRRRFHERALAVCLKIRLFSLPLYLSFSIYMYISLSLSFSLSPARNAINLIPFRSLAFSRRPSQRDE